MSGPGPWKEEEAGGCSGAQALGEAGGLCLEMDSAEGPLAAPSEISKPSLWDQEPKSCGLGGCS